MSRKVEEKIGQFGAWVQRNPGKRGQVCLSFYEKRQRQSWFRWVLPLPLLGAAPGGGGAQGAGDGCR